MHTARTVTCCTTTSALSRNSRAGGRATVTKPKSPQAGRTDVDGLFRFAAHHPVIVVFVLVGAAFALAGLIDMITKDR
jgi:hypothetical protein